MPLLILGLVVGAGGTFWLSDKAETVVKGALVLGAGFLIYKKWGK